ncbi:MAG: hypothetical protein U0172_10810 [Nitrospiraceae bacterium]
MAELGWLVFGIVLFMAIASKSGIVRGVAKGFCLLVSLAAAAAAVGLFYVGSAAHWHSDGPAMVFVMFGIPFFGMIAYVFASLAFASAPATVAMHDAANGDQPWELFQAPPKK